MTKLTLLLQNHRDEFTNILPVHLQHGKIYQLDLSSEYSPFRHIHPSDTEKLIQLTQQLMQQQQADIAIGGYAQTRFIYKDKPLFVADQEARDVHLGIDLTVPVGTPISAPLTSEIHSFKNNHNKGDYGPTIILQHQIANQIFYTLYGHLSLESLDNKKIGAVIQKGEQFATVGNPSENGGWPPHLHFQIIESMGNYFGDFPGVASQADKDTYLNLCPDPNLILNIQHIS